MTQPIGSVTLWISQLKGGDQAAGERLFKRFFKRLADAVRKQFRGADRGAADEEDVASLALTSLFVGLEKSEFPQLEDRDDLWRLLLVIARRRASNLKRDERRSKRGAGKVRNQSVRQHDDGNDGEHALSNFPSREPDPAKLVELKQTYLDLLDKLPTEELKSVAQWKLEDYTNDEIAGMLNCSLATVERRLQLIRTQWKKELKE